MTIREFGRATQVSKSLFGDEPFPPKEGDDVSPHMKAALDIIDHDFQRAKEQYFPNWKDAHYTLSEGPLFSSLTIIRKDGEPVPDDVYDAWYAWYYWNEYDEGQPEEQPQFIYPEEYTTETVYYRQFAWYTQAPCEEVNDGMGKN